MTITTLIIRAFLVFLLIAAAEVFQGILRVRYLNRRVGDHRARQIGVGSGCCLIFAITWFTLPWVGAISWGELIGVGFLWFCLMLAFDLGFGRLVFRFPWRRIWADFDPRRGNLLGLGMLFVFASPLLVGWLRGMI
jgi:hypothetical protein